MSRRNLGIIAGQQFVVDVWNGSVHDDGSCLQVCEIQAQVSRTLRKQQEGLRLPGSNIQRIDRRLGTAERQYAGWRGSMSRSSP